MRGRNPSADSGAGMAGGGSGRLLDKPFWPESDKSNSKERCQATSWMVPCILLELRRGHIAQCRVKPLLVINTFDEFADRYVGLGQIPIFGSVHLLVFECLHETFGPGIVIRISTPAHSDHHTVLLQQ